MRSCAKDEPSAWGRLGYPFDSAAEVAMSDAVPNRRIWTRNSGLGIEPGAGDAGFCELRMRLRP